MRIKFHFQLSDRPQFQDRARWGLSRVATYISNITERTVSSTNYDGW
jgi:hypothetical protein